MQFWKENRQDLTKYLLKYERLGNLTTFLDYNLYKWNTVEKWMEGCILPFLKNVASHPFLLESLRTTDA